MTELEFACTGVTADWRSAAPAVALAMRATAPDGVRVHAAALRCQVRVEPLRRRYDDEEAARLDGLFGDRSRWGSSMQPLQLAFLGHVLPGFSGAGEFELTLPCSYDVEVSAHRYLHALGSGSAHLLLLFSGTVFTGRPGTFQVEPIGWHTETRVELPVAVWREALDQHFPGQAWLRLDRSLYERLGTYQARHQLGSWDETLERLLKEAEA